jgi:hypothetical protein
MALSGSLGFPEGALTTWKEVGGRRRVLCTNLAGRTSCSRTELDIVQHVI